MYRSIPRTGAIDPESTPRRGSSGSERELPARKPAAETLFLGDGFANAEGPASITLGSSASVVLTIALEKPVRVENVTWTATPEGRHVVKARPVSATSNLQDAELGDVPIYSEMRARLDAPAFQYLETDWIEKEIRASATWVWNISPSSGAGSQAATLYISGPEGSGYEGIIQLGNKHSSRVGDASFTSVLKRYNPRLPHRGQPPRPLQY